MSSLNAAVFERQDDATSTAVQSMLRDEPLFQRLAADEGRDIVQRDAEDDHKLAVGIRIAIEKGALEPMESPPPAKQINVIGKSADEVAKCILNDLPSTKGNVIVLQGLSGTGKGTTVSKLRSALPDCVCWSNGNVFRLFTLMASDLSASRGGATFDPCLLTPEVVKGFSDRMSFQRFDDGSFDVVMDHTTRVSEIQNTTLKMPNISARVPTVAELTQGEVIQFARKAVGTLQANGCNVILEGRAQTLQYIPTPHRFELVIPEPTTLGSRRAAQRVMAKAFDALRPALPNATEADIAAALREALRAVTAA